MSKPQGVFVKFYLESVEFKAESEKAGRPIFKDIPFIEIRYPGDRLNVFVGKATDHFKQLYPREWAAFESGMDVQAIGTPLTEWPQITKSQIKEAEYFNVRTVEQLAEVPESALTRMGMGWSTLRKKAQDWLAAAAGEAPIAALQAENERLRADFEALKASLENPEIKRGRPRKEETAA